MSMHVPIGGRLVTKPFLVLLVFVAIAFFLLIQRFMFGLSAVTNLNDGYPWGIWIVVDVMIGTAFGCAGYAIALVVYLLNRGEYHPLVRPAVMAGMFGYTLGGLAVIIDLGRYWQFYTLLMPWYAQLNSVMLEVAWCVMAYVVVLWLEFAPAFLERFGLKNLRQKLSKVLFVIIAIGMLLPTMHQSSLGTMAVVLGFQINPLWQTQMLPLLFLISALMMGFAIVPFESVLSALGLQQPLERDMLGKLARFMLVVTGIYLALRVIDLTVRGAWGYAFTGTLDAFMFWVEMILFVVPFFLLWSPHTRNKRKPLFLSAICLLLAGSVYRINTYLIGYHPADGGWFYYPSLGEILVTVGVFSFEIVLYLIFVKNLPVLHRAQAT